MPTSRVGQPLLAQPLLAHVWSRGETDSTGNAEPSMNSVLALRGLD